MRIEATDANPLIVEIANRFSAGYPEIRYTTSDIMSFDPEQTYDVVHCSLTMHHFAAEEAVEVLRKCREWSHRLVLVTDLERSMLTRAGVWLANRILAHGSMTINDGDISARRAFSFREFRMLAKGAGWERFGHERFPLCRQALWLTAGR